MITEALNLEIWDRLLRNKPLSGLPVETRSGRVNLGAVELPAPSLLRRAHVHGVTLNELMPGAIIQGAEWQSIDFTGSKLGSIRFFDCDIRDCLFDNCQLKDWRVWGTTISQSSFKGANLMKSALGAVFNAKRNTYSEVDFSEADLRETVYRAAAFEKCVFRGTKLSGIDFQTSTFKDCIFVGELRDVLFYKRGFDGNDFPENEMVNVDFSQAALHDVSFRGLSLDRVKFPEDGHHIVIRDVAYTLARLSDQLKQQGDITAKRAIAFLNLGRRWVEPHQAQAVMNIDDMAETIGMEGVARIRELLRKMNVKHEP
jgi:uncharacterized protein YjbI with pentapeptide repeats